MKFLSTNIELFFDENFNNDNNGLFLNRFGGTDFNLMYNTIYKKNITINELNVDYYVNHLQEWNGYYDYTNNKNLKLNNLLNFLKKLDDIYRNNKFNTVACFDPNIKYIDYFSEINNLYFCYHKYFENVDIFLKIFQKICNKKKILIINSFTDLIESQITNLNKLYNNKFFLNCEFKFIKTPLCYKESISTETDIKENFFELVDYLCDKINKIDYDIALLGCGTYAHFLGEFIKNKNKKAIYIGGILPAYFGIIQDRHIKQNKYPLYFNFNFIKTNIIYEHEKKQNRESLSDYLYHEFFYREVLIKFNSNNIWNQYLNKYFDNVEKAKIFYIYLSNYNKKILDNSELILTYLNNYNKLIIE